VTFETAVFVFYQLSTRQCILYNIQDELSLLRCHYLSFSKVFPFICCCLPLLVNKDDYSALEVFFKNDMRYINSRFTYLLTYMKRRISAGVFKCFVHLYTWCLFPVFVLWAMLAALNKN